MLFHFINYWRFFSIDPWITIIYTSSKNLLRIRRIIYWRTTPLTKYKSNYSKHNFWSLRNSWKPWPEITSSMNVWPCVRTPTPVLRREAGVRLFGSGSETGPGNHCSTWTAVMIMNTEQESYGCHLSRSHAAIGPDFIVFYFIFWFCNLYTVKFVRWIYKLVFVCGF